MQLKYLAGLFLLGAVWGASFLFIKLALVDFGPLTLVALRILLAAVLLWIILRLQGQQLGRQPRRWRDFLINGLVGTALPYVLITWGEQFISSGLTSILNATTPLFTLLIGLAFLREERLGWLRSLGLLIGFAGVVVAVGVEDLSLRSASTIAQLAVLGGAICYGISGNFSRRAFAGLPALVPATGQMITGSLVMVPAALLVEGLPTRVPSLIGLGSLLALSILGTVIAYLLFYWLLANIGASRTSMVTYLLPPFALIYGALILSERFSLNVFGGLALVILGILLANGLLSWPARATAQPLTSDQPS